MLATIGQVAVAEVFEGNRRKEHKARRILAVIVLAQGVLDEGVQILLEPVEPARPAVGLVVAEEGKNNISLVELQPLVRAAEAVRAEAEHQLVAGVTEIAHDQLMPGKAGLQERFQPTVVLHAIGQGVADDADVIAFLDVYQMMKARADSSATQELNKTMRRWAQR